MRYFLAAYEIYEDSRHGVMIVFISLFASNNVCKQDWPWRALSILIKVSTLAPLKRQNGNSLDLTTDEV